MSEFQLIILLTGLFAIGFVTSVALFVRDVMKTTCVKRH